MKHIPLRTTINKPEKLFKYMESDLDYEGGSRVTLRTAEDVVYDGLCHCWEATEFERKALNELGYKTVVVFLATELIDITHTAIIYYDHDDDAWYWFEWAWGINKGISGPYESVEEATDELVYQFKSAYKSSYYTVTTHSGGTAIIHEGDTEQDFIDRATSWPAVKQS